MTDSDVVNTLIDAVATLPADLAWVVLVLLLLATARLIKDLLTPFSLREQLTTLDNHAVGMSIAGYYAGVIIVMMGPLLTPAREQVSLWEDLLVTGAYGLLGILLLNASRLVVDKLLLRKFSTVKEIVADKNVGTGAVEMGSYIGSGLIVAGSLHGQGGGPHTALVFYVVGQVGLLLYGWVYRLTCRYDIHDEIEKDNVAAGVSLGLNLVAIGVILMKGVSGDFYDWGPQMARVGALFVIGTVLLLLMRVLIDLVLLPGVALHKEIIEDRNLNAAWIEGAALIGMASVLSVAL